MNKKFVAKILDLIVGITLVLSALGFFADVGAVEDPFTMMAAIIASVGVLWGVLFFVGVLVLVRSILLWKEE
ncbi:MAG: hypothetical protein Q6363_008000 [Candidatus Njordarchaeota archaeon]